MHKSFGSRPPLQHQNPRLQRIGREEEAIVDQLLGRLTNYSLRVHGVPKMKDGARQLLTATPPNFSQETKHVFMVMLGSEPVGLVDVVDGFPNPGVAFVGLLAIAEDQHGLGLGRATLRLVEAFARSTLSAFKLGLAVVDTNPVTGFWHKMGFKETGEVRPCKVGALSANAILMEKIIDKSQQR